GAWLGHGAVGLSALLAVHVLSSVMPRRTGAGWLVVIAEHCVNAVHFADINALQFLNMLDVLIDASLSVQGDDRYLCYNTRYVGLYASRLLFFHRLPSRAY
ncbi:hypothetical protein, partial [Pseudomonas aeruginosa]|uniref:hypothetical protein n=1 Tax=Pseudomonas aeruginosa TaxID=287 RepID=UPI0013752DA7